MSEFEGFDPRKHAEGQREVQKSEDFARTMERWKAKSEYDRKLQQMKAKSENKKNPQTQRGVLNRINKLISKLPKDKSRDKRKAIQDLGHRFAGGTPKPNKQIERLRLERIRHLQKLRQQRGIQMQEFNFQRAKALQDHRLKEMQRRSLKLQNINPMKVQPSERVYADQYILDTDLMSGRKTLRKKLGGGRRELWLN